MEKITRRNFLATAGAVGAFATLGLAGCAPKAAGAALADSGESNSTPNGQSDWLGSAPEIAAEDIVETRETELLIVGAGNSGLAAAATAADLGLDFTLCEKTGAVQRARHWFGAINSKYTREAGAEVDEMKLLNEFSRYASGQADQRVIRTWITESAEMVDWIDPILTAAGMVCQFDNDIYHQTGGTDYYIAPMQHFYAAESRDAPDRNQVFLAYIEEKGHEVSFGHTLIKLVQDESGSVTGAIFDTDTGYVQINSQKGVLLATGGYVSNKAMLQACNPMVDRCVTLKTGSPNNTGDGIKAAMWAGAAKDAIGAPFIFDRGGVRPGQNAGITSDDGEDTAFAEGSINFNLGSQPLMKVSREGKRFCNESTPYNDCCFSAAANDGGVFCSVFDSNLKEDVARFSTIGCSRQTQMVLAASGETPLEEVYADAVEAGVLVKADTLEELADLLGFEGTAKGNFLAEVEKYNGFYDSQYDADFGKEPYRLSAIRKAPFFGFWCGGSILSTGDGIRINSDMQALDDNGQVIPGLYVSGDCGGSLYANNYPEYIVANACGRAITFGRHAVRHMAGDIA